MRVRTLRDLAPSVTTAGLVSSQRRQAKRLPSLMPQRRTPSKPPPQAAKRPASGQHAPPSTTAACSPQGSQSPYRSGRRLTVKPLSPCTAGPFPQSAEEVQDRRHRVNRLRRWICVDLPRVPGRAPRVRCHPGVDRVVRLVQAVIRSAVDSDDSFTAGRFRREHLARGVKGASDLNPRSRTVTRRSLLWRGDR